MSRTIFIVPFLVALIGACNSSASNDPTYGGKGNDPNKDGGGVNNVYDAGTFTIDPSKPNFQTKSSAQLLNSVKACFGEGMLMITTDMVTALDAGGQPVLAASFTASTKEGVDDIISVQKEAFDGDPTVLRQDTRADALTLQYVTAQRNMANVVARNCAAGKNAAMCACGTQDAAGQMLARCLPQLDPTSPSFQAAQTTLVSRCMTDPPTAIASFLASAAIAKLP